ncbi:MAG TPA: metallophosphoesterase family protein [Albitalea sp.]|nr:metallophosphoesterase family protein [Albitalea sp.]
MPEPAPAIRVGLISDTHGLLRPEALDALRGSDHLVHAGDIVDPRTLELLAQIAPVTAVRGNNDKGAWADALPHTATLALGELRLMVVHDLHELKLPPSGVHVVVSGHSHKPVIEQRDGVWFINPGSAGPRRFKLPVSVARLVVNGTQVHAQLIDLS